MMNLRLLCFCILLFLVNTLFAQNNNFITTWQTTSPNETITIPTTGIGYKYDVDWDNDGVFDSIGAVGDATHIYISTGIHTITIRGSFPRIFFNNGLEKGKIRSIEQWGDIIWTSMDRAFYGCNNLVINATDAPDLTNVTNMGSMFRLATSLNQNINHWDVSTITNMTSLFNNAWNFNQPLNSWDMSSVIHMSNMFRGASSFNHPLNNWNTSNVINMSQLFFSAYAFNQPIGNWNVSKVTNMYAMFREAQNFNQPIDFNQALNSWDVSSVINMGNMFHDALVFNQPIGNWEVSNVISMRSMFQSANTFDQSIANWNVSNVTDMYSMFSHTSAFNQPIGNWDVSNVIYMNAMFENTVFNQPIGNWDVSNVTNMSDMFIGTALSTENYDGLLSGWSNLTLQNNVNFNGGNSNYCNGEAARNTIINTFGWNIVDDGLDCSALSVVDFQLNNLEIFPNSASEFLYIKNSTSGTFNVYNVNGQVVLSITTDSNFSLKKIDISHLQTGIYFIKLRTIVKKIVIE